MERDAGRERGERAHRLGLAVNSGLALAKLGGGLVSGSPALLADGVHSIADVVTNAIAWLSFRVAAIPPDDDHHYGHGKAEAAAGASVGALLVVVGASVLWDGLSRAAPAYAGLRAPVALAVALVSMAANEWLYRVTARSAEELGSHALRALARDNRSDSLSSGLVVIGVLGSLIGQGWVEPLATAGIGAFIVVMGWRSAREGLDVLMDRVPDPELRGRIRSTSCAIEGVLGVQRVRVHPLGSALRVDMEISVDGDLSVREGHTIAHRVEAAVRAAEREIGAVLVHVNPIDASS